MAGSVNSWLLLALVTVHISSTPVIGRVRPTEIKNCLSYRNVYTMFTSCAIEALYDELSDMAFELYKETLNRTSFLNLIGNWCRILSSSSTCTLRKAVNCENLSALEVLLENTGGVCLRDGGLVETYLSIIPEEFLFPTTCLDEVMQTVDTCEDSLRAMDINESQTLEEGSTIIKRILEEYLRCGAAALKAAGTTCTQKESSLLYFVFRLLTFSMPHGLGVSLSASHVLTLITL